MRKFPALKRAAGDMSAQVAFSRFGRVALLMGVGLMVANCTGESKLSSKIDPKYGVSASPRVVAWGQPVPKGGGAYRVGKPYQVAGKTYVPKEMKKGEGFEGLASWYGDDFHGRLTANGEVFDMHSIAAAHPTLPMPSYVRVTNKDNGRSMVVRVNDRGPYHGNRVIDVSQRAADLLGFKSRGTARVKVEYIGPAKLEGSDDVQLAATLRQNGVAPEPAVMVASASSFGLFASSSPATAVRPSKTAQIALANVPLPPSRPFDLGEEMPAVASAEPMEPALVSTQPKPAVVAMPQPNMTSSRIAQTKPAPSVQPLPPAKTAAKPATQQRPVQVAQMAPYTPAPKAAPAPVRPAPAPELSGWVVGAQPAMGYASTGSTQGLY